jgi:hypothetical protein
MLEPPDGAAETPKDETFGLLTAAGVGPSSFCEGNCGGFGDAVEIALGTRFGIWSTLFMYGLPASESVVTILGICTDLTGCVNWGCWFC